ncbi:MAG: pyruvate:ferredoxin (flavodoxin) oxidoreductase [Candidatus Dadabacteria bacterium]|nr:MAG: pyruvate:ferredoxin (flavodoxin) oxidoreductase [Candidatus Dadabacteria bacterium]
MSERLIIDGNEAAARIAYQLNDVVAIYPITPASPMGEWADQWASDGRANLWGNVPQVVEMQSEGGAAGAVHGSLQAGALTTTFTASQGLLLMLPNMFKIAGELTSMVMHVATRSVATHALSIFCDHSDIMAARATGFAILMSNNVQEVMDMALIAQAATLAARVPFIHAFDGFRTSHEISDITPLSTDTIRAMIDDRLVLAHRERALNPDRPVLRGSAQNPDVFFQAREAVNPFYLATPGIVQETMDAFAAQTGRQYHLFEYLGSPEAEDVIVAMGSACDTIAATVAALQTSGHRVGLLKVRLYRPFDAEAMLAALPATVRRIAVLDRTKEPGAPAEPLCLDVMSAFARCTDDRPRPIICGGRYGLSSKEFTPAMVAAIFDELGTDSPRPTFTVGIRDDVTHLSLDVPATEPVSSEDGTVEAVFWGLGSDGTVGANKNSIKIIGERTDLHVQGYFVYDSKKSGAVTISHLRFGKQPIRRPWLIETAGFVACHQFSFLRRFDVLGMAADGATFLLNSPHGPEHTWTHLPQRVRDQIRAKQLRCFVIDAYRIAREHGLRGRINTVMQTCFFKLAGVLPEQEALDCIRAGIRKTYGKRGEVVVEHNLAAVDIALDNLHALQIPDVDDGEAPPLWQPDLSNAPVFVQNVTWPMIDRRGDELPVSALPPDGTFPTATARWEKRNIALEIPEWEPDLCIQCGKCVLVCPHAVIRAKICEPDQVADAPEGFRTAPARWKGLKELRYTLQVSPEDCTGCRACVEICPVKDKRQVKRKALNMVPLDPIRDRERTNWSFWLDLPDPQPPGLNLNLVKDVQLLQPRFEFSGACAGCGETPYLKLMSQLFGDRALVANATGCSSIYGGNLPTTPWAVDRDGRGPAWSNSLFEDNAEFGLGMRIALDAQERYARSLLDALSADERIDNLRRELFNEALPPEELHDPARRRLVIDRLRQVLVGINDPRAADLLMIADILVPRSVWIVGGDGWAYDIGYGGLDHVLASGANVNILVLDTEVYSNTGGQASKATPRAAVAKFAAGGKRRPKKDLAMMAMSYGNVYVARVAMGADDSHTLKAFREAAAWPGPSLILAYSHCIAHGYDLTYGNQQQKLAVQSGYWPLVRFDPRRTDSGEGPLVIDSKPPQIPLREYVYKETRYTALVQRDRATAERLLAEAQADVNAQWEHYVHLAESLRPDSGNAEEDQHA